MRLWPGSSYLPCGKSKAILGRVLERPAAHRVERRLIELAELLDAEL